MKDTIKLLKSNLRKMKLELRNEEKEFKSKFGIDLNLDLEIGEEIETKFQQLQIQPNQEQNLQQQIIIKKLTLENLINSAKDKLKSNSKFSDSKKKDRDSKLESFFKNIPTNPDEFVKNLDNIKENLSKKLS